MGGWDRVSVLIFCYDMNNNYHHSFNDFIESHLECTMNHRWTTEELDTADILLRMAYDQNEMSDDESDDMSEDDNETQVVSNIIVTRSRFRRFTRSMSRRIRGLR